MNRSMFGWVRAALLGSVVAGLAACGSSGSSDATTSGGTGCTPGAQSVCACPGDKTGVQICAADGKSLNACKCGSSSSSSGSGGAGGSSTGTQMETCGDGVQQAGECDPTSETHTYCAKDCAGTTASSTGSTGAGGSCAGMPTYAGMIESMSSVWFANGVTGLEAGNYMCQQMQGADHVCDYEEVLLAQKKGDLATVAAGKTAWVQRTTPAMVNGLLSQPGPGGRCNDWKYNTNHIADGEYVTFDTVGQPKFHLDNDTIFDGANPGVHTIPGDLECNGAIRNIMCCFIKCN